MDDAACPESEFNLECDLEGEIDSKPSTLLDRLINEELREASNSSIFDNCDCSILDTSNPKIREF